MKDAAEKIARDVIHNFMWASAKGVHHPPLEYDQAAILASHCIDLTAQLLASQARVGELTTWQGIEGAQLPSEIFDVWEPVTESGEPPIRIYEDNLGSLWLIANKFSAEDSETFPITGYLKLPPLPPAPPSDDAEGV